jgi:glycosyltransferase involved in cell wall biosynthesis
LGLVINGRFRRQRITGIQRVAQEVTRRLQTPFKLIEPTLDLSSVSSHLWEQTVLRAKASGNLLWGPCNTGPVFFKHQILTMHDASMLDHPEWFSPSFLRLYRALWPVLSKQALHLVTDSHYSKSRLCEQLSLPKEKVEVVWCGVDESFVPASTKDIENAKRGVGLIEKSYFVTLCTLEPRKNLTLVLQAWDVAKDRLPPNARLLIIGGKGGAAFAKAGSKDFAPREDVVYSGYVSNEILPVLLSGAIALLYPSVYEGFGLPLLEGMACGVPCVTTRLTSLPEVGGNAALYVDPADPNDLAECMIRLAGSADLREAHSALGLERAQLFTWTKAAAQMDHILQRYL